MQYFDEKWNSYLFINCKMENKDDFNSIIRELKQSLGINEEDINLLFAGERIHRKFSQSAKIEKEYQHYFYKVKLLRIIENLNEKNFKKSSKRYKWFSYDELKNNKRIQQVNSDIVKYIRELNI